MITEPRLRTQQRLVLIPSRGFGSGIRQNSLERKRWVGNSGESNYRKCRGMMH